MEDKEGAIKVFFRRAVILCRFIVSGFKITALKPYWRQKEVARTLFLSAVMNLAMWAYLYAHRIESDYPIILHYNLFLGVDLLGDYGMIYTMPAIGSVLFILNAALGQSFYRTERLASYILTLNIFAVQAILMLACYLVIQTNG